MFDLYALHCIFVLSSTISKFLTRSQLVNVFLCPFCDNMAANLDAVTEGAGTIEGNISTKCKDGFATAIFPLLNVMHGSVIFMLVSKWSSGRVTSFVVFDSYSKSNTASVIFHITAFRC